MTHQSAGPYSVCVTARVTRTECAVLVSQLDGPERGHTQVGAAHCWLADHSFQPAAGGDGNQAQAELGMTFSGKIAHLTVQPIAKVSVDDTTVVIEPMKLEYRLSPHGDVTVADMLAEVGQQVNTEQVLLRFETEEANKDISDTISRGSDQ